MKPSIKKTLFFAESILKIFEIDINVCYIEYGSILNSILLYGNGPRIIAYFYQKKDSLPKNNCRGLIPTLHKYGFINGNEMAGDENKTKFIHFCDADDKLKFKIIESIFNCNSRIAVKWPYADRLPCKDVIQFQQIIGLPSLPLSKKLERIAKSIGIYEQICIKFDLISC